MIYAHPTLARDPALVASFQKRTGHRAVITGRVVKLVPTARQQARIALADPNNQPTPPGAA